MYKFTVLEMFIKDGKSLFGNTGVILAIIILLGLLLLSYNKCMSEPFRSMDIQSGIAVNFASMHQSDSGKSKSVLRSDKSRVSRFDDVKPTPEPLNVRINISGNNVILNFSVNITNNAYLPKSFFVILVQFDKNMKNTGFNKFYLSNENELTTSASSGNITTTNLCMLINGTPTCQYIFDNLDITDANNDPYYYKIGISAIYDWGNSNFVTPYNVTTSNKLFTLNSSIDEQNNLFTEFIEYKKTQNAENRLNIPNSELMSSASGQYELIKSQLGGYPDNLLLNTKSNIQNSLSDLVDKSMAEGILNVKVSIPPKQTTSTTK